MAEKPKHLFACGNDPVVRLGEDIAKSKHLLVCSNRPCVRCNISALKREKMTHLCATLWQVKVPVTGEGLTI